MGTKKATFSYKNYLSPTPQNLQMWVESIHGGLILIVGSSWASGANPEILLILMGAGYVLDKLSKFFGMVAHDKEKLTIEVEGKDVHITKEETTDGGSQSDKN